MTLTTSMIRTVTFMAKKKLGRGSIPIPCDWSSLAEKATDNPVSVAVHYKKLNHDLMSILMGIRPGTTS